VVACLDELRDEESLPLLVCDDERLDRDLLLPTRSVLCFVWAVERALRPLEPLLTSFRCLVVDGLFCGSPVRAFLEEAAVESCCWLEDSASDVEDLLLVFVFFVVFFFFLVSDLFFFFSSSSLFISSSSSSSGEFSFSCCCFVCFLCFLVLLASSLLDLGACSFDVGALVAAACPTA